MAGDSDRPDWLVVGQISKPHGNKGEVFVWPLTDSPDAVFAEGRELLLGDTEGEPGEDLEKLTVRAWSPNTFLLGRVSAASPRGVLVPGALI